MNKILSNFRLRPAIQELLYQGLNEKEFNDLVSDYCPNNYNQFTNGQDKKKKAEALIDYTDSYREIKELLESIKKINPTAYKKYNLTLYDDLSKLSDKQKRAICQPLRTLL